MITQTLIENGGEINEELENLLSITQDQLKTKATDYASVIRSLEYDNQIIDQEIKRLQNIKRVRTNTIENLKLRLSNAMEQFEIDEIKTPTTKINFRPSTSLQINNQDEIPAEYKTLVTDMKVDKNKIKKDLKSGKEVKGAELIENRSIQIK
jgi:hypothetical protein